MVKEVLQPMRRWGLLVLAGGLLCAAAGTAVALRSEVGFSSRASLHFALDNAVGFGPRGRDFVTEPAVISGLIAEGELLPPDHRVRIVGNRRACSVDITLIGPRGESLRDDLQTISEVVGGRLADLCTERARDELSYLEARLRDVRERLAAEETLARGGDPDRVELAALTVELEEIVRAVVSAELAVHRSTPVITVSEPSEPQGAGRNTFAVIGLFFFVGLVGTALAIALWTARGSWA